MTFGLKPGYVENPGPVYFLDDVTETRGIVFQPDVYTLAEFLSTGHLIDVGCGWGDKLAAIYQRHPEWEYLGVDYGTNIEHCRAAYPWGQWLDADLEGGVNVNAENAVVVCSDVIEHLVDPIPLLDSLRSSGADLVVISTPERDIQYGYDHMGPSKNLCHVREWNAPELHAFIEDQGFTIVHHGLTRGSDQSWVMGTQVVVCR